MMLSILANGQEKNKSFNTTIEKSQNYKLLKSSEIDNIEFDITDLEPSKKITSKSLKKEEQTLRLDSLTTVSINGDGIYRKGTRVYNSSGKSVLSSSYDWSTDLEKFIPYERVEYTYDTRGNRTLLIIYRWDNQAQILIPDWKAENAYDNEDNQTLRINYNWDTTKESFVPYYKLEQKYNSNGFVNEDVRYGWDSVNEELAPGSKTEYEYNADGSKKTEIRYYWDSVKVEFMLSNKSEFTYDTNGNQNLVKVLDWDSEKLEFLNRSKREYFYDAQRNLTLFVEYEWASEVEFFYPTYRTISEVDDQMRIITTNDYDLFICSNLKINDRRIEYSFIDGLQGSKRKYFILIDGELVLDYESGLFYNEEGKGVLRSQIVNSNRYDPAIFNFKIESEYDDNGNRTLSVRHIWDTSSAELIPGYKQESTYDEEDNTINHTYSNWFKDSGDYKNTYKQDFAVHLDSDTKYIRVANLSEYDLNSNTWNVLEDETYKSYWYYSKVSTLTTESAQKEVSVIYPNPTSNFIKVRLHKNLSKPILELFDATGKQVLSQSIESDLNIDISKLKPAIYFYKIKDGKDVKKSGEIIKVK